MLQPQLAPASSDPQHLLAEGKGFKAYWRGLPAERQAALAEEPAAAVLKVRAFGRWERREQRLLPHLLPLLLLAVSTPLPALWLWQPLLHCVCCVWTAAAGGAAGLAVRRSVPACLLPLFLLCRVWSQAHL